MTPVPTGGLSRVASNTRWAIRCRCNRPVLGVCRRETDYRYSPEYGDLPTRRSETMKVWIDQDLCTGDGLCEEIAPAVFTLLDDGLAYVKESDKVRSEPGGAAGMALVPEDLEDAVTEAAEECPGECIFIEQT